MRLLLGATAPGQRAGTLASSYPMSYAGAAVPSLFAGRLVCGLDVRALAGGFALLSVVAAAGAFVALSAAGRAGVDGPG